MWPTSNCKSSGVKTTERLGTGGLPYRRDHARLPFVRQFAACLMGIGLLFVGTGCRPSQTPRPSSESPIDVPLVVQEEAGPDWETLVAAVGRGETDTIDTSQPIEPVQLESLSAVADQVQHLLIDGGRVNNEAMAHVGKLQRLVHLRLRESPISNAGLKPLVEQGGMPELRILNLPQALVTAEGLRLLAEMPKLEQVRLGGPQLDDRAAEELARFPQLRSLHLIGPKLTAEGLNQLAKAPKLTSLYIDDCPLPDEAWEKLFEAKPTLHVHIDQRHHDRDPSQHAH